MVSIGAKRNLICRKNRSSDSPFSSGPGDCCRLGGDCSPSCADRQQAASLVCQPFPGGDRYRRGPFPAAGSPRRPGDHGPGAWLGHPEHHHPAVLDQDHSGSRGLRLRHLPSACAVSFPPDPLASPPDAPHRPRYRRHHRQSLSSPGNSHFHRDQTGGSGPDRSTGRGGCCFRGGPECNLPVQSRQHPDS